MKGSLILCGCLVLAGCAGGDEVDQPPPPAAPQPNRAPVSTNTLVNQTLVAFHPLDFDTTLGGTAFADPDGDPLTYTLQWFRTPPAGLGFSGARIVGSTADLGQFNAGVTVRDGRGGELTYGIFVTVVPNTAPPINRPNQMVLLHAGDSVNLDTLQAGTTFGADPQGDPVTYGVSLSARSQGLVVNGTHVSGVMPGVGAVRVRVTATDVFGTASFNEFIVTAPAPEPGAPDLPVTPFVYEDDKLSLPAPFRMDPGTVSTLSDTTPADNRITDAGATLGRVLFYDKRLSSTNLLACGSCHRQSLGFSDNTRFSEGATGEPGRRNAMPLTQVRYNAHDRYFSDIRVRTLEALALMPIEDPSELANTVPNVIAKLQSTSFYPGLFHAAFGTPEITQDRVARALAQFLRSLISYNSKFDRHRRNVDGSIDILDPQEREGLLIAHDTACTSCHTTDVQTLDLPTTNGLDAAIVDPGADERGRFRAASLRNIARSAPYMHDGRFATLREVIDHYDHGVQLAPGLSDKLKEGSDPRRLHLTETQKVALEAFLNTLTDEAFLTDPRFSDPFR